MSESSLLKTFREKFDKVKGMVEDYKKQREAEKNPPKPEEIEMTLFYRASPRVSFAEPLTTIIRAKPSVRVQSDPIDIIYPVEPGLNEESIFRSGDKATPRSIHRMYTWSYYQV